MIFSAAVSKLTFGCPRAPVVTGCPEGDEVRSTTSVVPVAVMVSAPMLVAAVAEQSSASAEQVSASTQETSASTQEIASSAAELAKTAEQLDQLVRRFKVTA